MRAQLTRIVKQHPGLEELARKLRSLAPGNRPAGEFWHWYRLFEEMESWDTARIKDYQLARLKVLLAEVRVSSPFYARLLAHVDLESLSAPEQISGILPALNRQQYAESYREILAAGDTGKLSRVSTSGTTGRALQFYHHRSDEHREWAAICHQWKRVGFDPRRSVRAEFRGLLSQGRLVQRFPDQRMIRCSILDIGARTVPRFAEAIAASGADFYHGYPSALYLVARQINAGGLKFPQPKALLLASEQVYPWQLDELRQAFPEAKIISHYGCTERVVLAAWCEHRQSYHVLPQYSLVEVDPVSGELIGTNLFNTVNPFIRYRLTDQVTELVATPCPDCRRPYTPLLQLSGRSEDFLYSPEKGWIPPALVTYPLKSLGAVREVQFVQREKDLLLVRYSLLAGHASALEQDLASIEAGLVRLFGAGMRLRFEQVDDFDRGPTGKFKWLVCELDRD